MYRIKLLILFFLYFQLIWPCLAYFPCSIFEEGPCLVSPARPYMVIYLGNEKLYSLFDARERLKTKITKSTLDEYSAIKDNYQQKLSKTTLATDTNVFAAKAKLDVAEKAALVIFFKSHSATTQNDIDQYYYLGDTINTVRGALYGNVVGLLVRNVLFLILATGMAFALVSRRQSKKAQYLTDLIARSSVERSWFCIVVILLFGLTFDDMIMLVKGEFGIVGITVAGILAAWSFCMILDTVILVIRVKLGVYGFNSYEAHEIIAFARAQKWADNDPDGRPRTMRFPYGERDPAEVWVGGVTGQTARRIIGE